MLSTAECGSVIASCLSDMWVFLHILTIDKDVLSKSLNNNNNNNNNIW